MAKIAEELILYDKFSGTFTKYLRYGGQAAGVTQDITKETQKLAKAQQTASTATSGFLGKLQGLVGAYMGLQGLRAVVDLSDAVSGTTARLNMMNDGLQTTKELQDMIFQSAQRSRGDYLSTAGFVSQLGTLAGDAFSSNAEIIAFAEQINKQIALSGTSSQAASAAIYQLTQGLSSGALRGEELNSVLEQTPMIAQTIADYMGVTTGEMRELASEGKITANVVKNALLASAEETNAAFENMPKTWGQVWTSFKNQAIMAGQPVLNFINLLANNIEIVLPLVIGLGTAFAIFQVAANWVNICTAATTMLTNAQRMLGAAMATAWGPPLIIITLVITAVYALTAAFNKLTGSSVSATGIITGAFAGLATLVINGVIRIQNVFAAFANFFGNVFKNPVAAVKMLFFQLADTAIGYIAKIAAAIEALINKIPGVSVDITSSIDRVHQWVKTGMENVKNESDWKEYVKSWDYQDIAKNAASGYEWGANLFGGDSVGIPTGTTDVEQYLADIASDTDSIKGAVSTTQEDLKMMVDMAERRFVANVNLSAPAPTITIQGQNTGNSREDTRRMLNQIAKVLQEDMNSSTQMNYAFIH